MLFVHGQTLDALHRGAHYAHLDVTCNNIMRRSDQPVGWNQIRLIDLGLAEQCVTGMICLHLVASHSIHLANPVTSIL